MANSNHQEDCIFCKIATGEMSTPGVFWENDEFMAFLSKWPSSIGFSVVIPKRHYYSDVMQMPDDVLERFILAAKEVSAILREHFSDVGRVGVMMEGTGINHAHIKLTPMHGTEFLKDGGWEPVPSTKNDFYEKYEGFICSNDSAERSDEEISALAQALKETRKKM